MDLYENTLIGTFLYGLGLEIGTQLQTLPLVSGVDLLQQTPLDQSLGDVLIKAPRYFRLIEFKRAGNRDSKEQRKLADLKGLLSREPQAQALIRASLSIHRIVHIESKVTKGRRVEVELTERSYIPMVMRERCTIPDLCRVTAKAMLSPPPDPSPALCAHYLRLLGSLYQGPKNPTGGGGTLLVAVRNGIVEHAHVSDLADIWRSHEQLRAMQMDHDKALEQTLDGRPKKSSDRKRDFEGPER